MRRALIAVLGVILPSFAWADSQPTFIKDAKSGCAVGTFHPEAGLAVQWTGPCVGGKAQGRGIAEWSVGGKFSARSEGDYHGGLLEGRVISVFADERRQEAEYRGGMRNGRCITTWSNGQRFDGQCANDQPNGVGKWHFASGDRYYGDVRNGQMEGHGIYAWKDGRVYDGDLVADKSTGRGKMVWPDGHWYDGEWRDDKFDGDGVEVFDDGAYYRGQWRDGHPDGTGEYVGVSDNGHPNVWSGQWHQGCFQSGDMTAAVTTSRDKCDFD
jgi:hypothetical protein